MGPFGACGEVPPAAAYKWVVFSSALRYRADPGANSISVARRANKPDRQPVISVPAFIAENNGLAVVTVDGNVNKPVIVQVSEGSPTRRQRNLKCLPALS